MSPPTFARSLVTLSSTAVVIGLLTAACVGDDPSAGPTTPGAEGTDGGGSGGEGGPPVPSTKCTTGSECANGICADGVCCASACNGQCEACNVPGSEGQCVAVKGPPRAGHAACKGLGDATCGGSCDGTNRTACAYPTSDCRAASCTNGVATAAAKCADGACAAPSTTTCANTTNTKICGATTCVGVTQISAGYASTCALLSDQTVRCWGDNTAGQLGTGDKVEKHVPTAVTGLTGVSKISAGAGDSGHACALLADQTAKCWGNGNYGSLGNGVLDTAFTPHPTPAPVLKSAGVTFPQIKDISAGQGVTCFLDTTGKAWCMGYQGSGAVGNGSSSNSGIAFPQLVTGPAAGGGVVRVGYAHSCSSTKSDSSAGVLCWGDNFSFSLGIAEATGTVHNTASAASFGDSMNGLLDAPLAVGGDPDVTCAISNNSTLQCWGSNTYGQLGRNTKSSASSTAAAGPVCVDANAACTNMAGVISVGIGEQHACAVTSADHFVRCWGSDVGSKGSLGQVAAQVLNAGSHVALTGDATAVAVGGYHACALLVDRTVQCWGWNVYGQLGDSTTNNATTPVAPKW